MVTLKNGSTLIIELLSKEADSVVLASTERDFVTWRKDSEGNCFSGNYYPHTIEGLEEAVSDLKKRGG